MNKVLKHSIGYVSSTLDLPQSVIRYWETVFDTLQPEKTEGGTRKYSEEDLLLIRQIKTLLYDKKFTIKGANKFLKDHQEFHDDNPKIEIDKTTLLEIVNSLENIIKYLKSH